MSGGVAVRLNKADSPHIFEGIMKIRLETEGKNAGTVNYKGPDSAVLAVKYLNSIDADEVQINIVQDDGTRAFAEFEGEFLAVSAVKFIESVLPADPAAQEPSFSQGTAYPESNLTLKERLEMFLRFEFSRAWFSSLDVKTRYETIYGNIGLSTVSTYLARMHRDNVLEKRGNRINREYRFRDITGALNNIEQLPVK
ncbi:Uncharacterised protein [uncultured archaeon]|nr:Uncharacterised protein [uncultured archaeon]